MNLIVIILTVLAASSLTLNAFLLLRKIKKPNKQETYDVKELLNDLLSGRALVEVRRISPADIFLRSPKS